MKMKRYCIFIHVNNESVHQCVNKPTEIRLFLDIVKRKDFLQ